MADHRLIQLENIIEANQHKFYQTGKALKQIRDDRLFRDLLFDSFEAYVKDRWDMARSQAYRLITAAEVIDNLSPIGDGVLPQNEFQTRVLARFTKAEQRKIWRAFIASGRALTAKNIRKCTHPAKKAKSAKKTNTSTVDIISTDYKAAVMAMLEQIRSAQNDDWQTTSRQAALFWLKVMKEKIIRYERRRP
jgi:hypothetical protein